MRRYAGLVGLVMACASAGAQVSPAPGARNRCNRRRKYQQVRRRSATAGAGAARAASSSCIAGSSPCRRRRLQRLGPLLTLTDCIRLALGRGFDLEIERQSLFIAQDNVPIARSTVPASALSHDGQVRHTHSRVRPQGRHT